MSDGNVTISFLSRSILHTHQFSWVFLVDWIMILFLSIFVLYYFNQLLGFIITHTLCKFLWYRYGVYVKIQSLQISLLGGRVLFRNLVYIGTSQAVKAVHGTVNWRYWIPKRQRSAYLTHTHLEDAKNSALQLKVHGLEWFVYNREYAYDILATKQPATAELAREIENWHQGLSYMERKLAEMLPLHIEARHMGIVIGNDDTESLIVASVPEADCFVDIANASNKYDRYMSCVHANFHQLEVRLQNNPDYQVSSITPDRQYRKTAFSKNRRNVWMQRLKRKSQKEPEKPWLGLKRYMENSEETEGFKQSEGGIGHEKAHNSSNEGVQKSYDSTEGLDNPDESEGAADVAGTGNHPQSRLPNNAQVVSNLAAIPVEYAKVSQLLVCDLLKVNIHVDVVGKAVLTSQTEMSNDGESNETYHGDKESQLSENDNDPLFDIQIQSFNTKMNYGPYAERQRQQIMSVFFPRNCVDASLPEVSLTGTPHLNGLRMHPKAVVNFEFVDEATLVVPIRETSKDQSFIDSFLNNLHTFGDKIQRTYGWLEVRAAAGSSVDISMPFLPSKSGFDTKCKIHMKSPDVRSSVNHDTMFCSENTTILYTQHLPLIWNAMQTYTVEIKSDALDFYALREHAMLINDMTTDFSTGPPVPYALFCPSRYLINWNVSRFSMYLNVNKGNVINKPTSISENTFLILRAPELFASWEVPRELITSPTSTVNTLFQAKKVALDLNAPNWHTLHGFLDWQQMARVDDLSISLQHHMTTVPAPRREVDSRREASTSRLVDTQIIEVSGNNFAMTAHGFLIDYVMRIRENYFGHAYHFQTTEEFLQKHKTKKTHENPVEFSRSEVDTDTHMRIRVQNGCFLLPTRLYSCKDCISLHFIQLNADCRFTNYYMDLQVEVMPLTGKLLRNLNTDIVHEQALEAGFSNADLSISQIDVHAHRMFGLPPIEPTYVVRWDFDIGDITADFPLEFWTAISDASLVFDHSFTDDENKPILEPEELNDVTFVSVNVASVDAIIRPSSSWYLNQRYTEGGTRFHISTSTIKVRLDDLASDRYSASRTIEIPFIGVKGYTIMNQLAFEAQTAVYSTTFVNKQHCQEFYEKQQKHIALHDSIYHRAPFLLDFDHRSQPPYNSNTGDTLKPCIPITPFDPPITRENLKLLDPQFVALDDRRRDNDSSHNPSMESLASSNQRRLFSSDDSEDEASSIPKKAKSVRIQSSGPSPDVYPFSSSTVSAERERLRLKKSNFDLKFRRWHPDAPCLIVDDEVENISTVVQITSVEISFTPSLFSLIEEFDKEPELDFEAQLDNLQIHIVKGLNREERIQEIFRAHLVTPLVSIDFSESIGSNDGIRLDIKNVDTMVKISGNQRGANASFDTLAVSLRHGSQDLIDVSRINAISLILSKFSFWWQETSQEDGTGSFNLENVDVSVAADSIEWAFCYLGRLASTLPRQVRRSSDFSVPGNKSQTSLNKPNGVETNTHYLTKQQRLKATFFALTIAGERMAVQQDSYVLSRPSGAIQSQAHVRTKTSWRLIMRLRYLLQRLPSSDRLRMEKEIMERKFRIPEDAKEQTLDVYSRWRSWEQSKNLAETEIFKLVFDDKTFQEYVLSLSTRLLVKIESMVARIVYNDMSEHFAGLDTLEMQLVSTQKNDIQNLNLTFRGAKARARGGIELLGVATSILTVLTLLEEEKVHKEDTLSENHPYTHKSSEAQQDKSMETGSQTRTTTPRIKAFQASISVFLLDLSLEFDLVTLHIETQNHQIQFTSAIELMESEHLESLFHTGTLITSDSAFRIYQKDQRFPESGNESTRGQDVLDSLVQGVNVGYTSRGLGELANTWATVNLNTVSFITHPTALNLTKIFAKAVDEDLSVITSAIERLQKAMPERRPSVISTDNGSNVALNQEQSPRFDNSISREISHKLDTNDDDIERNKNHSDLDTSSYGINELSAGQYVNINISSFKLKACLVEDLRFAFQSKDLFMKIRHVDELVSSLDLAKCIVGIHFGDGSASVANTQVQKFRSVLRYDSELMALAIFNTINTASLETMSLVWILEYAKHRHIDHQATEIIELVNNIFFKINDNSKAKSGSPDVELSESIFKDSSSQHSTIKPSVKLKLRLVNKIHEISVRLPLDTSSFKMVITGARINFENFESFQELEGLKSSPETISTGIDDLKLELHTTKKPVREIMRLRFSASVHKEEGKSLFDINSDLIHFALDPETVGAIFIALEKLKENSRDIFISKEVTIETPNYASDSPFSKEANDGLGGISKFENIRVKLLLKDLTVTWYTSSESNEGIILGFDQLKIRIAKLISHEELSGVYMTPVSTSTLPIKNRMNTIYLPSINVNSFVSKDKDDDRPWIQGAINGKSIVVTLNASIAPWLMSLADSIKQTSDTLEQLALTRHAKRLPQHPPVSPQSDHKPEWQLVNTPFNVLINTHFDRGILRVMEDSPRTKEPAMELLSPTLDVTLEFKRKNLMLRIDASKTTNEIFPKAITELKAISTMIGLSMRKRSVDRQGSKIKSTGNSLEDNSTPIQKESKQKDVGSPSQETSSSVFDKIEFDIRVHFGSQELYLSCLPFGKVGALLATDGLDILTTAPRSTLKESAYVSFYGLMKRTRISLQHMYSREISAMIEFSQLVTLGMHRQDDLLKTAINLKDPKIDIDLSKLHDMRTFFDIWALFGSSALETSDDTPEMEPQTTKMRRKYSTSSNQKFSMTPSSPILGGSDETIDEKGSDKGSDPEEKDEIHTDSDDLRLIDKYRKAMSSVPFAFIINFTISDMLVVLGMGPSIGEARVSMNRGWIVAMQSVYFDQTLNAGVDTIMAQLQGRLGGVVKFDGIMTKMAMQWKDNQNYPLVHGKLRIKKSGFYFSLDFHPFITGIVQDLAIILTTQDQLNTTEDRIHFALICESMSLAFTALFLAHSLDVISLFKRLQSQISNVHIFTPDVAQQVADRSTKKHDKRNKRKLDHQSNGSVMRVLIDVHFGELLIHAFPTEFVDNTALKIFVSRFEAHCDRKNLHTSYETGLDLAVDGCIVGLASIKGGGYNKTLTDLDYEGFLAFASKSVLSSTIINTPEVTILMDTWYNARDPQTVYYTFSNEVHGSVEMGWNFGSINFIKEMINSHKDAWIVRQNVHEASIHGLDSGTTTAAQAYREATANIKREGSLSARKKSSTLQSINDSASASLSLNEDNDMGSSNNEESNKIMMLNGIKYISKKQPVVLIPQLRDLGDATPPIEWLGLNRERIPLLIHYFLTRKLALGADEIEKAYLEIIGRLE